MRAKLEIAYFSILTPYPGTRLHTRLAAENRLLTEDWDYYDANHVVFRPKLLSPEKLLEGYHYVMKEFYSMSSIFRRLWGTTAWKNLFYPMNFGFRQGVRAMVNNPKSAEMLTAWENIQKGGVADGTRTRNIQNHNLGLYH